VQQDHAERAVLDVAAQSIRASLARALARLARPDRDVLLLIAWEQLSYDEVARALNIPVGTVRSRLHRARTKIRGSLADRDRWRYGGRCRGDHGRSSCWGKTPAW
jgi:RNA polymerase sigma-70 factor (ECF subfamily)